MIDLHIHTIASDGQHTAAEVVAMARDIGLEAIAIADHNSVESVGEGRREAKEAGIEFAEATELDTVFHDMDLHLLGYFIEVGSATCRDYMKEIHEAKLGQTRERVRKLQELGFKIDFQSLLRLSGGRLPYGVEYMRALQENEDNLQDPRVQEYISGSRAGSPFLNFYLDWLKSGRPAFVPLEAQPTEKAIQKIKQMNGVPVLAHPSDTPFQYAHELVDAGLQGIEVYSSYHDDEMTESWLKLAQDRNVLITAGSDFHGKDRKPDVKLAGIPRGDYVFFRRLKEAAGR